MGGLENARQTRWTPERVAAAAKSAAIVVVLGVVLGMFATGAHLYYVAALAAGAVLAALVAWQFEAALVIYALVAFVPWGATPDLAIGGSGIGKGVYVSELMLGFLLVVWFGKYLLGKLPQNRIGSGFYVPLALYLAYCVLNVVNAYLFWDPHVNRIYQHPTVNVIELGLHFLSAGALVMMATTVTNRKWLTWATFALLVPGIYNGLNGLTGGRIPIAAPWGSLLTLLPAGYLWAVALDAERSIIRRGLAAGGVALAVFTVFTLGISWVSGWLGLLAAVGVVTFIKSRKVFFAVLAVTCVLAAVVWPFLSTNVVEKSQSEGDYDRFSLMAGAIKYASAFPLGVGLGNYRTYNSFYYGEKWGTTSYTSAHGTYSQHLSEMGFPGLVLLLVLLGSGFRWMWMNYRALPPGLSKAYLLAAMGQLVGVSVAAFIGDYLIPTYHNGGITTFSTSVYSWLIWGLAIAHVKISRDEANGPVDCRS